MKNCLVTKLKASVDNNSLPKLGVLQIGIKANSSGFDQYSSMVNLRNSKQFTITAKNGAYFAESYAGLDSPATRLTSLTVPQNTTKAIYVGNKDGILEISEKYTLVYLGNTYAKSHPIMDLALSDLKYSTAVSTLGIGNQSGDLSEIFGLPLVELRLHGPVTSDSIAFTSTSFRVAYLNALNVKGNLSQFPTCPNLETLDMGSSAIMGDITLIAKQPVGAMINIINSGITGTIEGLVESFVDDYDVNTYDGKNIGLQPVFQGVTFGGTIHSTGGAYRAYLSWIGKEKIWISYGASSLATCPNILCKGFTQEEAEEKWPGKTVQRVDA